MAVKFRRQPLLISYRNDMTPTPIQTGMVNNCDSFHLIVSGDDCFDIANAADVTLTNFKI
jgi:hypothetical protein